MIHSLHRLHILHRKCVEVLQQYNFTSAIKHLSTHWG